MGGRKKSTSASCNGCHHHQCKECLRQWLKEKRHKRKLQPVTTMCESGVLTTSAMCKGQGARCKGQDRRCKGQDQHQRKSVRDAATTFNYNHHHHHRPGPTLHDAAITATCIRVCKEFVCPYASCSDCCIVQCWQLTAWGKSENQS